jgi:putative transposase
LANGNRMQTKLMNDALLMALCQQKTANGLVWHADRGCQYASDNHHRILKQHQIFQSMSRKGNCWDNAVSESFFHAQKTELTHHCVFKNQEEIRNVIFEYIKVFYNRIRTHSKNKYVRPSRVREHAENELKMCPLNCCLIKVCYVILYIHI